MEMEDHDVQLTALIEGVEDAILQMTHNPQVVFLTELHRLLTESDDVYDHEVELVVEHFILDLDSNMDEEKVLYYAGLNARVIQALIASPIYQRISVPSVKRAMLKGMEFKYNY